MKYWSFYPGMGFLAVTMDIFMETATDWPFKEPWVERNFTWYLPTT
jgi:hypothetical protein